MSDPTNITGSPPPAPPAKPATESSNVTATPPAAAAAPPKPAAAPPKPAPAAKPAAKKDTGRRFFLLSIVGSWFAVAWTALGAATVLSILGTIRFLFPNVLSEPPSKVKVGAPDEYEEGKVVDRFKDQNIWVVRNGGIIYALSTTCTHLGCTPNWLEREEKFKCPCHGSGFKITGINFEGPAPRPLERWAISLGEDGKLIVDKSKKFQKEQGQWDNPESFFKV
jgi:cytochrome b6-f complex iron-sulfur subunit